MAPAGGALASGKVTARDDQQVSYVAPSSKHLSAESGGGPSAGRVIPVEGPDGLLWLCREDEEALQSICIPWFQSTSLPGLNG